MTTDAIQIASVRLQHWWELHGSHHDPTETIHRIAAMSARGMSRRQLEDQLFDRWAQLCAEGDADDYSL